MESCFVVQRVWVQFFFNTFVVWSKKEKLHKLWASLQVEVLVAWCVRALECWTIYDGVYGSSLAGYQDLDHQVIRQDREERGWAWLPPKFQSNKIRGLWSWRQHFIAAVNSLWAAPPPSSRSASICSPHSSSWILDLLVHTSSWKKMEKKSQ